MDKIGKPKDLPYYLEKISNLACTTMARQKSPHKPALLLTVGRLVRNGVIKGNRILLDDTLRREFDDVWEQYCGEAVVFKPTIKYPFERLQTDGIWKYDSVMGSAIIDTELIALFSDDSAYAILEKALVNKIFLGLSLGEVIRAVVGRSSRARMSC